MNYNNKPQKLALISYMLILTACSNIHSPNESTPKQWEAIGGSKSDAVIELSYEYNINENSKINEASAYKEAKYRCENWGYKVGAPFNSTKTCLMYYNMNCMQWEVKEKFQCT